MKKILIIGALSLLMIFSACTQYVWIPVDPDIINGGGSGSGSERLTAEEFALKLDLAGLVEDVANGTPTTTSFTGMKVTTASPATASMAFVTKAVGAGKLYLDFTGEGYSTGNGLRIMDGLIELTFDISDANALSAFHLKVLEELVTLYGTDDEPYTVGVTAENEVISGKIQGTMTDTDDSVSFSSVTNITVSLGSSLVVDGETVQAGGVTGNGTSESSPFVFTTADQLFAFAADYNAGDFTAPVYVELGSDINIGNTEWTPIGASVRSGAGLTDDSTPFIGVFDGNEYTISGMSIGNGNTTENAGLGFFSAISGEGTVIKNILIQGTVNNEANGSAGILVGIIEKEASVENCTVLSGSSITAKEAGGIAGRMLKSGSIVGSENNATVIAVSGKAGGIVNSAYYDQNATDAKDFSYMTFKIEGCTNNGAVKGGNSGFIGGIAGLAGGAVQIINCTNSETGTVVGVGPGVGGIAGQLVHGASLDGCYNHAAISNTGSATGGLVGWIRYHDDANYNDNLVCTINNSHNDGNVSGTAYAVGGAVGMVYWAADISESSSAGTISSDANNMVGGFCGGVQYLASGDKEDTTDGPTTTTPDANYSENRKNGITFTDCHSDNAVVDLAFASSTVGKFIGHNVDCLITDHTDVVTTITNCTPTGEGSGIKAVTQG